MNLLLESARNAFRERRRLVAPLLGFPGLTLAQCTVKVAQQNFGEHFRVLNAIAEAFSPDAIFPLMDLSVEANALGRFTLFPREESATVVKEDFSETDFSAAQKIDIANDSRVFGYVETLRMMKQKLSHGILKGAYVTGPYTLAALLIGADEAATATLMRPDELYEICKLTTEKILVYVRLLIEAGADMICVLEPSAVMLGPKEFGQFSARYVSKISAACTESGVASVYHICGNSMHLVEQMANSGVDALSLDSPQAGIDLPAVAKRIPADVVLIGNASPIGAMLTGKPSEVEAEVQQLLGSMDPFPNFILSTGCDLPQETPADNIHAFMKAGRSYVVGGRVGVQRSLPVLPF